MPSGGLEFFLSFSESNVAGDISIFLSFNIFRGIGGLKGEVGRCAKWRSGGGDGQWLCQL